MRASIRCLFIQGTEYPLNGRFIALWVQVSSPELVREQALLSKQQVSQAWSREQQVFLELQAHLELSALLAAWQSLAVQVQQRRAVAQAS